MWETKREESSAHFLPLVLVVTSEVILLLQGIGYTFLYDNPFISTWILLNLSQSWRNHRQEESCYDEHRLHGWLNSPFFSCSNFFFALSNNFLRVLCLQERTFDMKYLFLNLIVISSLFVTASFIQEKHGQGMQTLFCHLIIMTEVTEANARNSVTQSTPPVVQLQVWVWHFFMRENFALGVYYKLLISREN